jgi:peptide deformylase
MFNIVTYGNECLGPVESHPLVDDDAPHVIKQLKVLARTLNAPGFAANQLGFYARIIIVRMNDGQHEIMQNPVLSPIEHPTKSTAREYCYSLPGYSTLVERDAEVNIEYMNETGVTKRGMLTGDEARYVQHEVDHLDGKLISDYSLFGKSKLKQIRRRFVATGYAYSVDELGMFHFGTSTATPAPIYETSNPEVDFEQGE